jgi:hypothetical protein
METANTHAPIKRTLAVSDGGLNIKARVYPLPSSGKPKLLEQVRQTIRTRHYSHRTEKAYVHWIKRFIFFHNKRHPAEMGEAEMVGFFLAWQRIFVSARPLRTRPSLCKDIGYGSWNAYG